MAKELKSLGDKRKEIIKDINNVINEVTRQGCLQVMRRVEKQDKEFIEKCEAAQEFDTCLNKFVIDIDKLKELIEPKS